MSRSRSISTEISSDERLGPLGEEDPLAVMLYALAIPHADDWGRLKGDATAFRYEVAPFLLVPASQIDALLDKIAEAGLWTRYEVAGRKYIAFPREAWFKHQSYINMEKRTYDGSKLPAPPGESWQPWERRPSASRATAANPQESPRNSKNHQGTPKNPTSPSPSPTPTPSLTPTEEEEDTTAPREARYAAGEALRPTADTQAGAIFPPDRPLPLLVQDFIQAKAGADAPRWEAELRLKLECKPLTGSPDSYMLGVLRGWVRDGGPPQPTPQRAGQPQAPGGQSRGKSYGDKQAERALGIHRMFDALDAELGLVPPTAPPTGRMIS